MPDHSWLSLTRARLPHEVHTAIFDWVLALIAEAGLVKGERIGVDASTMEANAALRNIVRRDTVEGYRGMLARLAQESGIETPAAEDLARLDRKRKGKKLSNLRLGLEGDLEAKIAKMKDGTTHWPTSPLTRWIWTPAAVWPPATPGRRGSRPLEKTLAAAKENLVGGSGTRHRRPKLPGTNVCRQRYHSRSVIKALDDGPWKAISEPKQKGFARWRRRRGPPGIHQQPTRLLSGVARKPAARKIVSAPLRQPRIAAACAHGCAGAERAQIPAPVAATI